MQSTNGKGFARVLSDPHSTPLDEQLFTSVFTRTRSPPGVLVTTCAQVLNQPYPIAQDWLNRQMDGVEKLAYLSALSRLKFGLDPTQELITMWAQRLGVDPHVVKEWVEEQNGYGLVVMSPLKQGRTPPPVISSSPIY